MCPCTLSSPVHVEARGHRGPTISGGIWCFAPPLLFVRECTRVTCAHNPHTNGQGKMLNADGAANGDIELNSAELSVNKAEEFQPSDSTIDLLLN